MVYEEFNQLIITNGERLFSLCNFVINQRTKDRILNRKFLGRLNLEATWMEETLDSYGSKHNSTWFPFRETVAAQKLFSSVCYDVIHLKKAVPYYNLLSVEGNFTVELDKILDSFYCAIFSISGSLLKFLRKQKINVDLKQIYPGFFHEKYLDYQLEMTKTIRDMQQPEQTLVYLATSFLNLSSDTKIFECRKNIKKKNYEDCIPDHVSEEKLRLVKAQFHNLQSMYDTHLSKTYIERKNSNLHILRGHISVIFHLLSSATNLSHYYERHMVTNKFSFKKNTPLPMSRKKLLSILMEFFLNFSSLYLKAARNLCRSIISEYAEDGKIEVGIPNYRGFHVRPSTLISKIVLHYGSKVIMEMGNEKYDASSPLELFRANEKINAEKRKYISRLIDSNTFLEDFHNHTGSKWPKMLQLVILDLMDKEEIILYEKNLSMKGNLPEKEECPEEFFKRIITLFLASGKIDIKSNLHVNFYGDKRVLHDLRVLAEAGYGEDKYGNNIILPSELAYLKR
ncbi:MAG: HPr family phosphocarrier protein [Spirochaetales bacterium]|nr:HPr family phosphocarrier protein [Spirochaetales bacterium]